MSLGLTKNSLLDEAKTKTGLDDFGNTSFEEGLDIFITSFNSEEKFSDIGYHLTRNRIIQLLINRLQVQDWVTRHPEILKEKIEQPLIITGVPRSGTTFLQYLLSLDPVSRGLHYWEASIPCPPPELIHSAVDPRIQNFHNGIQVTDQLMPESQAMYPVYAGGFAEDHLLLSNEFKGFEFIARYWMPTYTDWFLNCNMSSAYEYHKKVLQLLQWRFPNERWVLKSPTHLISLDALLDQYPDAQIVFTHRDPLKAMASVASITATIGSMYSDKIDNFNIANMSTQLWANTIEKAMKVRDRYKSVAFYDLQFNDFMADPINSIKNIYKHFGRNVGLGHERRMQAWIRDNPKGKHGQHRYSLEKFGIDPKEIRQKFAVYQERFEVPVEK